MSKSLIFLGEGGDFLKDKIYSIHVADTEDAVACNHGAVSLINEGPGGKPTGYFFSCR